MMLAKLSRTRAAHLRAAPAARLLLARQPIGPALGTTTLITTRSWSTKDKKRNLAAVL
jgi:hypothetical protein